MDIIQTFYDNLAPQYEDLFLDWEDATYREAEIIHKIIKKITKIIIIVFIAFLVMSMITPLVLYLHSFSITDPLEPEIKYAEFPFELVFLVMDPGYNKINREMIEYNAKMMSVPITVFESTIFDSVYEIDKSPCYLCARMRRGYLYSKAKELGCNKIALGHHYDDVIETILMGMLYGAQVQTMMPKLHSTNFEGMELIRPLYLVREEDIQHWKDYNRLEFIQCACRFTENCCTVYEDGSSESKRMEIKQLIAELKKVNPYVESNIFKSVENVNLSTIIAYKENGVKHHFLDTYDK